MVIYRKVINILTADIDPGKNFERFFPGGCRVRSKFDDSGFQAFGNLQQSPTFIVFGKLIFTYGKIIRISPGFLITGRLLPIDIIDF